MMYHSLNKNHYVKLLSEALDHTESIFAIYDQAHRLVFANSAAFETMPSYFNHLANGKTIEEAIQHQIELSTPDATEEFKDKLVQQYIERQFTGDIYEVPSTEDRVFRVKHEKLEDGHMLGMGLDVTALTQQRQKLEALASENFNLANTDQLTGQANRRQFIKKLDDMITKCKSSGCSFFVGLIDLNGFKRVNDIYGHAAGDDVLSGIALRATEYIEDETFLARLGGDEFALITHANQSQVDLLSFSAGLCEVLRQPHSISGNDISVSASLGWASYPTDGETASELLQKSDYALYKSKYSDARQTVVFSNFDKKIMMRESEIALHLEGANLEDELFLEFQPIFDTKNNVITAFEALVRWDSPILGLVNPMDFIPLAEKTGRISDLTKIILRKALQISIHWPKSIDLHVNISAIDLGKIDVISELIDIITLSAYPAQSVVFEVTETAVADTFENTSEIFDFIQNNGVRLALDDFGVGFSSLSYLARTPVTCLKVDKHFTQCLEPNSNDEKILKTIFYLAENLEIDCIVEGVENASQLNQLMALGATHMQGFYFSKSIKPQDLTAFILRHAQDKITRKTMEPVTEISRVA